MLHSAGMCLWFPRHMSLTCAIRHSAGGVSSTANMRSVTPHASLVSPRTTTAVLPEPIQPFHAYLAAEFRALDLVPVGDSLWGQTERDRV